MNMAIELVQTRPKPVDPAWPFPRIRWAREDELEPLMDMARRIHAEIGQGPTMDEDAVRDVIMEGMRRKRAWCAVVGDHGRIEGSVFLILGTLWYNPHWYQLEELWNYVLPDYRRSTNAKELLRFTKWLSGTVGLPLMIGVLNTVRTEAKLRLYQRELGQPSTGAYFLVHSKTGRTDVR